MDHLKFFITRIITDTSGKKGGRKLDERIRIHLVRIIKKGDVDNAKQPNNELNSSFGLDVS